MSFIGFTSLERCGKNLTRYKVLPMKDLIPLKVLGIFKVEMALTLDPKGCIVGIPLALNIFKPIYFTSLLNVCNLLRVNNKPCFLF